MASSTHGGTTPLFQVLPGPPFLLDPTVVVVDPQKGIHARLFTRCLDLLLGTFRVQDCHRPNNLLVITQTCHALMVHIRVVVHQID
jgi:hypothetical protein